MKQSGRWQLALPACTLSVAASTTPSSGLHELAPLPHQPLTKSVMAGSSMLRARLRSCSASFPFRLCRVCAQVELPGPWRHIVLMMWGGCHSVATWKPFPLWAGHSDLPHQTCKRIRGSRSQTILHIVQMQPCSRSACEGLVSHPCKQ